ncbi:EGF-like domain protein [Aphelenchoides fujianensis]|nr:EGF-like domain protein [Aphelenchoides fujianensis]
MRCSTEDGLKTWVRRARQIDGDEQSVTVSAISNGPAQPSGSEACTAEQCSNRGTCFGSRSMPFCFCTLGYAGKNCEDRFCDSARDCNGRGWCMGTSSQFSCLCNLGFSGTRCELQTMAASSAPPTTAVLPREPVEEAEHLSETLEEQI